MPSRPDVALHFQYENTYGVAKLIASPSDMSSDIGPRGWSLSKWDRKTWLADLQIQGYIDHKNEHVWGYDTRYYPSSVDLNHAEVMVTVLRQIDKAMRTEHEQSGYAETFFEYVTMIARILGITRYTFKASDKHKAATGNWWKETGAEGIKAWISEQEALFCKRPPVAEPVDA